MKINITCGDIANEYYSLKYSDEVFIPFNEAMIKGIPKEDIFSSEFISERVSTLETTLEEYLSKMKGILLLKDNLDDLDIICWFGDDDFCKINLLTLFAYLEQIGYKKNVVFNLIDEMTFEVKCTKIIDIKDSKSKYLENILLRKLG